jgi:hypothetical protein
MYLVHILGQWLDYGLDNQGIRFKFPAVKEVYSCAQCPDWLLMHPASCPVSFWVTSLSQKADESPLSNAEVKSAWSLTLHAFMA